MFGGEVDVVELDAGVDDRDAHRRAAAGDARVAGAVRRPGARAEDPVRRDLDRVQGASQLDVGDARVARERGRRLARNRRTRTRRARASRRRAVGRPARRTSGGASRGASALPTRVTIHVWSCPAGAGASGSTAAVAADMVPAVRLMTTTARSAKAPRRGPLDRLHRMPSASRRARPDAYALLVTRDAANRNPRHRQYSMRCGLPDSGTMTDRAVDVLLVSHTHWDREWYRTFEAFRARLVDTVDRVLELLADDPGWKFVLDGQAIVLEDYLAVRPDRRGRPGAGGARRAARARPVVRAARLAAAGGRVARAEPAARAGGWRSRSGAVSTRRLRAGLVRAPGAVPAALRRLRARDRSSTGAATATSSTAWARSTAGSRPTAAACSRYHLGRRATSPPRCCPTTPTTAVDGLLGVLDRLGRGRAAPGAAHERHRPHAARRPHRGAWPPRSARRTGLDVARGLLDDLVDAIDPSAAREHRGELLGARTREPPARRVVGAPRPEAARTAAPSRRCSAGPSRGRRSAARSALPDERPSLHAAWRTLLQNQAHDSICGCSQDAVHRQMHAALRRRRGAGGADAPARVLERLAGLGAERRVPWQHRARRRGVQPVAVPAHRRRARPARRLPACSSCSDITQDIHPLTVAAASAAGYTVDGAPVRVDPVRRSGRGSACSSRCPPLDVELVVADVPAFGYRRSGSTPGDASPGRGRRRPRDRGRRRCRCTPATTARSGADRRARARRARARSRTSATAATPTTSIRWPTTRATTSTRSTCAAGGTRRGSNGVRRSAPRHASADRGDGPYVASRRRVAPGVERVDLHVDVEHPAPDHRLRLCFPTGAPVDTFRAATTFDTAHAVHHARRRRELGAPGAAHLPAPGMGRGERAQRSPRPASPRPR